MKPLVFGGTREARELCVGLSGQGIAATVCAATDYGAEALGRLPGITARTGRLDARGMARLIRENGFTAVIDATHPYAEEVTANIRAACRGWNGLHIRVVREAAPLPPGLPRPLRAGNLPEAVRLLGAGNGKALITTGSRDIALYSALDNFAKRLYIRVLPDPDVIRRCRAAGFASSHIIAVQGPFSREFNAAMLRQFGCSWLLTKDTGAVGGLPEKLLAAGDAGARVLLVELPGEGSLPQDGSEQRMTLARTLECFGAGKPSRADEAWLHGPGQGDHD